MKLKYYLRGLGIGVILTTILLSISYSGGTLTDEEVIERAKKLGMVMQEEQPLFSTQKSEKNPTEQKETEVIETEVLTSETVQIQETEETVETEEKAETEETAKMEKYHLVIPSGSVPRFICNELEEQGLIDSSIAFRDYLVEVGYATSIVAGEYDIPYGATYEEIYKIFKAGPN